MYSQRSWTVAFTGFPFGINVPMPNFARSGNGPEAGGNQWTKSSKNSDAGAVHVTNRKSRARVQAT
jgi:hypothetical protein